MQKTVSLPLRVLNALLALVLVVGLAPAISFAMPSQAWADDAAVITVNEYGPDATTLLKTYSVTQSELAALAAGNTEPYVTQMVRNYNNAPIQVYKSSSYVNLADLFEHLDIKLGNDDVVHADQGTSFIGWSRTWKDLTTKSYYYPNLTGSDFWASSVDTSDAALVGPVLALSYAANMSVDASTTSADALAALTDTGDSTNCPRWFMGVYEGDLSLLELAANKSTSNVDTISIVHPAKLSFDMQGHGDAVDSQTIAYDGFTIMGRYTISTSAQYKTVEPEEPAAEGYIFDGWYTDKSFETAFEFGNDLTADTTLYAKWIEDPAYAPQMSLSTEASDLKVGDTFTVAIDMTNITAAAQANLAWSDNLELESIVAGSALEFAGAQGGFEWANDEGADDSLFSFVGNQGTEDGTVALATFECTAAGEVSVSVAEGVAGKSLDAEEHEIAASEPLELSVALDALKGDLNNSGKVNIVDAQICYDLATAKYEAETAADAKAALVACWADQGATYDMIVALANVNGDEALDSSDAFAIQHYAHTGEW